MVIEQLVALLRDGGGRTFAPHASPIIVDLRPTSAFAEHHLLDANSVPIADLKRRMYELPPPGEWPIELLGEAHEISRAQELLTPRGWTCAELDAADAQRGRPRRLATPPLRHCPTRSSTPCCARCCCRRARRSTSAAAARDAAYLAQRLPAGWSVHGVDNHVGALGRARELAAACGLSVGFEGRDVRKELPRLARGAATAAPRPRLPLPPPAAAARRAARRARARRPARLVNLSRPARRQRRRGRARRPPAAARRAARGARGARLRDALRRGGRAAHKGRVCARAILRGA